MTDAAHVVFDPVTGTPRWRAVAPPEPAAGQVLVAVAAAGLNRADLLQRDGAYRPPPGESAVPGLECAGEILACGPGVTGWRPGQRVAALLGSGAYATHAVVPASLLLPVPDDLDLLAAALLPEAVATVWWNLAMVGGIRPGRRVLVHAANSGVGTTAVRVAALAGARVAGTVRDAAHAPRLLELGADLVVESTHADAADQVRAWAPAGVDIVLDLVGAAVTPLTLRSLGSGGRWLSVGVVGGDEVTISLREVIRRRLVVTGSSLRSLPGEQKAEIIARVRADVWPWVAAGTLRPVVDSTFPAHLVGAALARLERGGLMGKIGIDIGGAAAVAGAE